jgi:amino acid transporter
MLATIFPALPVWLMAFVFIVVLTAVNLTSVKNFGEFEFWFALVKVAAIGECAVGLSRFQGSGTPPFRFGLGGSWRASSHTAPLPAYTGISDPSPR